MENFIVSARKYRPDTFRSVVGQASITQTLKNSIKTKHLGHAYLFTGPRGVGKTTCARIFAKTINCFHPSDDFEACNECESCKAFNNSRSYNIHELDAASNNSVEDIRTLIEQVRIPPQIGTYSVYIIDEVHMLSTSAFNAFLKTLEEPPKHALFVLATTEKHKILPTILSRCQIFDFNRIKVEDTVNHLAYVAKSEGITAERDALNIIAQKADGAMRDALSFFDQIVSFSGNNIKYQDAIDNLNVLDYDYYFRLVDYFMENNIAESLMTFDKILDKGFDGHHFISGLSGHIRDLLICRDPKTVELLEVGDNIKARYLEQSAKASLLFLLKVLELTNKTDLNYREAKNKRLQVELALINACNIMNNAISTPQTIPVTHETQTEYQKNTVQTTQNQTSTQQNDTNPARKLVRTSGVSLNRPSEIESTTQQTENKDVTTISKSVQLNQALVNAAWLKYLESVKNSLPRLYNNMKDRHLGILSETLVSLNVPTEQFKEYMDKLIPKIIPVLRTELKHETIEIQFIVAEETETKAENKLYTDKDKYQYLAEKNNNVELLKQKFNLDF